MRMGRVVGSSIGVLLALAGCALIETPEWAPGLAFVALAAAAWPLMQAWSQAHGTALRPAVFWAGLAVCVGLASLAAAWVEPVATGRPVAGHLVYLSVLCTFGALVSVLNARKPGAVAWAILMALLVGVFLIPWLEGPWMARKAHGLNRLHLDAPWSIFYLLVVVAGVTNYLPTRYGPAAAWLGAGLACEYLALTRSDLRLNYGGRLWPVFPWTLAAALWTAQLRALPRSTHADRLIGIWKWFRDHWGVVWALRVEERFNRAAEMHDWPFRLGWFGATAAPSARGQVHVETPEAAEPTLRSLLRRFATEERIDEVARFVEARACPPGDGRK